MNIGIIAHNSKYILIEDFCIAYKGVLAKHDLYATGTTGRHVEAAANLRVHKFLPGNIGGDKQFIEMIERNAMDMVIFLYNPNMVNPKEPDLFSVVRACDMNNIPCATNIASAELLIMGLQRGDLDWRLSLERPEEDIF
ncbi:MAG: methylglyoxal synthase [Lachnospiraceae bacterium]|nr:methylglyoxal synthase [Candidatus Equihabitans merdae]